MDVTKALVLAALCATAAHAGTAGEGEYSARLEARVDAALERMLGPGRAAATVEVRGERVTKREESQISGSAGREAPPDNTGIIELPGYTRKADSRTGRSVSPIMHAASEETLRESSFAVSGVRAWLVVDKKLDEEAVSEAARVTGEILALDLARGDELSVVRTAFVPSWRAAFSRPRDARALALLGLAAAALLLTAALIGRALMRSSAALAEAISNAPPADTASRRPASALPPRRISPLPPLGKGGHGP